MATFTIARPDLFPSGTTVKAYLGSAYHSQGGEPQGPRVSEAVATSTGVTLTALSAGVAYVAWAPYGGTDRYLGFEIPLPAPGAGGPSAPDDDEILEVGLAAEIAARTAADALKAPLLSPAFTGVPTAPTPAEGDNSAKLATTAYVDRGVNSVQIDGGAPSTAYGEEDLRINFGGAS